MSDALLQFKKSFPPLVCQIGAVMSAPGFTSFIIVAGFVCFALTGKSRNQDFNPWAHSPAYIEAAAK